MSANPLPDTSLTVFIDQAREILRTVGIGELIGRAKSLAITDDSSFAEAGSLRSALKGAESTAQDRFKKLRDPLNELRTQIISMEQEITGPLHSTIIDLDGKTTAYRREQQRLADDKRRLEEEAARKIEEDRRTKEAEAAIANGIPESEALSTFDEPFMPIMAPSTKVVPAVPGQAFVETWSAELVDLKALVRHVAEHPEHLNFLLANLPALNAMARASKSPILVPGVRGVKKDTVRGRAAQ